MRVGARVSKLLGFRVMMRVGAMVSKLLGIRVMMRVGVGLVSC